VRDLYALYLALYPSLPLVINLDGWVRGLGLELMRVLLQDVLVPDVVVKMQVREGGEGGREGGRVE